MSSSLDGHRLGPSLHMTRHCGLTTWHLLVLVGHGSPVLDLDLDLGWHGSLDWLLGHLAGWALGLEGYLQCWHDRDGLLRL